MRLERQILTAILIFTQLLLQAQNRLLHGVVKDEYGEPMSYVAVSEKNRMTGTYTDENGRFSLSLPAGKHVLNFCYIGYQEQDLDITLPKDTSDLSVQLQPATLHMQDVVVTARQVKSQNGTSAYRIDNQAIRQIQAMTLGDVLTLLPGKKIGSTSCNQIQQPDLRSAISSPYNNIGTAVIMNGMSLHNDANMQISNPTAPSDDPFSTAGRSIDLRNISAAGIESIEVVTGIPSAKYGNLSTGAIIVKNKTGVLPLTIAANTTGETYQAALSQGFELQNNGGILNAEASYTYSLANPVFRKSYWQNFNAGLRWTRTFSKEWEWNNTLAFQTLLGFNGERVDKDERVPSSTKVNNQQLLFNVYGDFKMPDSNTGFSYSLNANIDHQYSCYMFYGSGPIPIVEPTKTGTYITGYSPAAFKQEQIMKGLPTSLSADFDMNNQLHARKWDFHFQTGLQYSYDKNFGKGRSIIGNAVQNEGGIGARSALFNDIPASMTLSAYHETTLQRDGRWADLHLRLGLRYDYMNRRYHLASPRLSASVELFDQWTLRAAWGLAYKAPTMMQLYPGPAYYDFVNLSWFAPDPAERLAVVSTYVYQAQNQHLRPQNTNTLEIGTDWESPWLTLRLTAYHKQLRNAIALAPELLLLHKQLYEAVEEPVGRPPVVRPIEGNVQTILQEKQVMQNCREEVTDGIELMLIPAKIKATNTEFNFQGSWVKTTRINKSDHMERSQYIVGEGKSRYGLYKRTRLDSYLSSGRLALIQHFPRIGLVFTLNTELNFVEYTQPVGGSIYPYAYYDHDGQYHDIPESEQTSAKYDDLVLNDNLSDIKDKKPFYTNFHLQVRKETRSGHSFSLYANNFLWLNPTYVFNGNRRTLNDLVEFGFNMTFQIGGKRHKQI